MCCISVLLFFQDNAPTNVKPHGGGVGYTQEIDSASFPWVLPWGREFDIATNCFGQKVVPRGGNIF